jgi:hypothetical protein
MAVPYSTATLCDFSDFEKRVKSLPFAAKNSDSLKSSFEEKHDLIKERIRKRLLIWMKPKYGEKSEDLIQNWLGAIHRKRQEINTRFTELGNNTVYLQSDGVLVSFNLLDAAAQSIQDVNPALYFKSGPPSPTDFANVARNGAKYVDLASGDIYVNKGTLAVPSWIAYSLKSLLDFIDDLSLLNEAAVSGTVWLMLNEGILRLKAEGNTSVDIYKDYINPAKKLFEDDLSEALQLLDIDESGDGVISNYERSDQSSVNYIF